MRHVTAVGTHLRTLYPQMGALIHTFGGLIHTRVSRKIARFSGRIKQTSEPGSLVGVQRLAQRTDVTPEIVVLGHLALDLFAAVEHGRVISATERLADPQ